jgi:CRP-like cAMP-binding protein
MDNFGDDNQGNGAFVELSLSDISSLAIQGNFGEIQLLTLASNSALSDAYSFEEYLVIVQAGWVALKCDEKAFCVLRPGEVFFQPAWPAEAVHARRTPTLFAATPVALILVERTSLLAVTEPNLMFSMYAFLFKRMLLLMKTMAQLSRESRKDRLTYFLWHMGLPMSGGTRLLPQLSLAITSECLGIPAKDITHQREVLRYRGHLIQQGPDEYLSPEVGAIAMAAGYGLD